MNGGDKEHSGVSTTSLAHFILQIFPRHFLNARPDASPGMTTTQASNSLCGLQSVSMVEVTTKVGVHACVHFPDVETEAQRV